MNNICILGSLNLDMILGVPRVPKVGETIFGDSFKLAPGGKGANQAVAAARLGAHVFIIGKTGKDENGKFLINNLNKDNINTDFVFKDEDAPTGTALISVYENGNNSIVVVPGANMTISLTELEKAKDLIKHSEVLISQFETPKDLTLEAFKYAKKEGLLTILNPAPAGEMPEELYKYTDIIVPNETECRMMTGVLVSDIKSAEKAGEIFLSKGVKYVIITLGELGAAIITKGRAEIIPSFKVKAVDTTAAGDSFIGALGSRINLGRFSYDEIKDAIRFANKVSSIAVQRKGAQPSIPYLKEIDL